MKLINYWLRLAFSRDFFLKDKPLATKFFALSALLVIVPMVLVGVISYYRSAVELENEAREYSWQVIEQVETHVEYYIRDLEISSLKIVNNPDTVRLLKMKTTEEIGDSKIRPVIENMLRNAAYSRSDISNITLILEGRQVFDVVGPNSLYPASKLKNEYWYDAVPYTGNALLVSRVVEWPDRKEPVISLVRRVYSPQTLEPVGMLIIDINFKRIKEIADKVYYKHNGHFFILDAEGHYVYNADYGKIAQRAQLLDKALLPEKGEGWTIADTKDRDFLTYSYSPYLGWRFVTSIPYSQLTQGAGHIGQTIMWTVVITLIVAYILGAGFAAAIIMPIRRLHYYMRSVETGNFSVQVRVESEDEIGQLAYGFNKMVKRLSQLMEEVYFSKLRETQAILNQKEMELKVLQSQMNPHFLCNSLETIRGMALARDMEDIAAMAAALGRLLRYNLRNHSYKVPLREEIKLCEVYMQVQQFRFGGQFTYTINIPEWAWDLEIVKFSLQPLVENSFAHGLGWRSEPIHITISAMRDGDAAYIVKVADDGVGIEPDVLAGLRADLEQKDVTAGGQNIGIVNVHRRITRMYDMAYGITIHSRPGEGTTVNVRLPFTSFGGEGDDL